MWTEWEEKTEVQYKKIRDRKRAREAVTQHKPTGGDNPIINISLHACGLF